MAIDASSVSETYKLMQQKLSKLVPDVELRIKAELVYEINRLKRERGAIILGHNYMEPALFHTVPDVVGDSLELSRRAAITDCDPIIFCGVRFMAETAKILNPNRTVLLPAQVAGCSLAESITAEDVRRLKAQFPGVPVVSYINTYADVKAESDYICTSGNAARLVASIPSQTVIFLPDRYLAANVAKETGKEILFPSTSKQVPTTSSNVMIGWRGVCEVHDKFSVDDINNVKAQFPDVEILAHPECSPEVVAASSFSASTSKMVEYVRTSKAPHFLLLTECSMADNIIAENPDKDVLRLCSVRCPHMNEITLEDTLNALRHNQQVIDVPEDIRVRAKAALDRMLAVT
jgi:quinolinate synthase